MIEQPLGIDAVTPVRTYVFEGGALDRETILELARNGRIVLEIVQEIDKKRLISPGGEAAGRYRAVSQFVTRRTQLNDFYPGNPSHDHTPRVDGIFDMPGVHSPRGRHNPHRRRSRQ